MQLHSLDSELHIWDILFRFNLLTTTLVKANSRNRNLVECWHYSVRHLVDFPSKFLALKPKDQIFDSSIEALDFVVKSLHNVILMLEGSLQVEEAKVECQERWYSYKEDPTEVPSDPTLKPPNVAWPQWNDVTGECGDIAGHLADHQLDDVSSLYCSWIQGLSMWHSSNWNAFSLFYTKNFYVWGKFSP